MVDHPSTPRDATGRLVVAGVVALHTAVLLEIMRVSFPLLYDTASTVGFDTASWAVPLVFALPLAAAPLGRRAGPRLLLVVGGGGLAIARVIVQIQDNPALVVALPGTLLGLVGIAAGMRLAASVLGAAARPAFFLGLTLDAAIRIGLTTWDAAWQATPFAWFVGTSLPLALVSGLVFVLRLPATMGAGKNSLSLAALAGPVLALQTLFMANPGFVASSGELGPPAAGGVVLAGLLTAAVTPAARGWGTWAAGSMLVGAAAALTGPTGVTGPLVWLAVVAAQASAGALVGRACLRSNSADVDAVAVVEIAESSGTSDKKTLRAVRPTTARTGAGAGVGSLALVAVLLPYQISYEIPLGGLPQFAVPAAGALLVVALAFPGGERGGSRSRGSVDSIGGGVQPERTVRTVAIAAPVLAGLVPLWSAWTWPEPIPEAATGATVRVATFNIHSAVSWHGQLDPDAIARVLEDGDADIAMLQEVSRGWPLAGGLDSMAWLSRRLGADVVYGSAADNQFGNAVLSTYPIERQWSDVMDRGQGTMQRGYVGATVAAGPSVLDVWSTHLQHQDHTTATRRAQASTVVDAWQASARTAPTVIGGDFNSRPNSPDIGPWFDGTGLVSAQDVAGDPSSNTSPAFEPDHRIDWLLGSADISFADVAVPSTLASDHLPVFATIELPGG